MSENFIKTNWVKIALSALAVLVAGGGIFGLFKYFTSEKEIGVEPKLIEEVGQPYLKADLEKTLIFSPTDPGSVVKAIKKEIQKSKKSGALHFFKLPYTLMGFLELAEIKMPESLIFNSHPSFNIYAAYHTGSSSVVFLIKTENFEKAYGSLLAWEKDMWQSFSRFLDAEDIKNINQFYFFDEIIKNHDARILKNAANKSILAYAIFNKQFVATATSREGLSIILQRLIASPPR